MYEDLKRHLGTGVMNGTNLLQAELTSQYHLPEASLLQELHLLWCAVVHLRAGMEWNWRKRQSQQAHVLHNQRIHSQAVELPH